VARPRPRGIALALEVSARPAPTEIASPSGPPLARWDLVCSGPPRLVRFGVASGQLAALSSSLRFGS